MKRIKKLRRAGLTMTTSLMLIAGAGCAHRSADSFKTAPPTSVAAAMRRQVLNAADLGEGDAAAVQWRRQIAGDPTNVSLRLDLAAHYGRQGLPELELEHLRVAVERFPASSPARLALAGALRRAGLARQAAESLEAFLAAHPGSPESSEALNLLGICYDEAGEWRSGEQAFRRAVALSPGLDHLHNNLGHNLLEQKRVQEAVAEFQEALRRNPQSVTARNNLGLALSRSPGTGVSEALKHFETVTDAATAHSNLAAALIEQSRYQESRRLLEAALDYNRSHPPALANLKLVSALDGQPPAVRPAGSRNVLLWPFALVRWALGPQAEGRKSEPRHERPVVGQVLGTQPSLAGKPSGRTAK